MRKQFLLWGFVVGLSCYVGSFPSLQDSVKKKVLDFASYTEKQKEEFNELILKTDPTKQILSFKGERLEFLDLSGIRLCGVDFSNCHFNGVNLRNADLSYCKFQGATFEKTNLRESILVGIDFNGCCFKGADLQGAVLTESFSLPYYFNTVEILKEYSKLKDEKDKDVLNQLIGRGSFDFSGQKIEGLDLRGINLSNCSLDESTVEDCDLTNAEFGNSSLRSTIFSKVKLSEDILLPENTDGVDLVRLYGDSQTAQKQKGILNQLLGQGISIIRKGKISVLEDLNLQGIDLRNTFISDVSFKGSDLTSAILGHAKTDENSLQGTILREHFKVPEFKNALDLVIQYRDSQDQEYRNNLNQFFDICSLKLSGKNLRGFNLRNINFSQADLMRAKLQGTVLFDGFVIPDYKSDADLIMKYSEALPEERVQFNKLFEIYPLNLMDADLSNLDLGNINLSKAFLEETNFKNSNLRGAIFPSSKKKCKNILLGGAILPNGNKAPDYESIDELLKKYSDSKDEGIRRNINQVFEFTNINLSNMNLNDYDLSNINLKGQISMCQLERAVFKNAKLEKFLFYGNNLREANFTGAHLNGTDFLYSSLQKATFFDAFVVPNYGKHADLVKEYSQCKDLKRRRDFNQLFNLIKLCLDKEVLKSLDLKGINLDKASVWDADFTESDLTDSLGLRNIVFNKTRWSEDFVLPDNLTVEKLKRSYHSLVKTDEHKYLFQKVWDGAHYDNLEEFMKSVEKK